VSEHVRRGAAHADARAPAARTTRAG
jgi:hypothetical protein